MSAPIPSEGQRRLAWLALSALALAALVGVIVGAVWGLGQALGLLAPVLWPLAVAGVLAYLLDPVVDWLEHRRIPRTRAIVLVFFVAAGLLLGVLASVAPRVVVETTQLAGKAHEMSGQLQERLEKFAHDPPPLVKRLLPMLLPKPADGEPSGEPTPPAWDKNTLASVSKVLTSALPSIGAWLGNQFGKALSLFGIFAGLALIPVYAFYFLLEKRGIVANWTTYLPLRDSSLKDEVTFVIRAINDQLIAFFRGQVLVALCDAVLYTIGFLAIGLSYAFLIGFVAVFLTMIPFIGAFVVVSSALVLAFVQYGDLLHPLLVLAVFAIVQTLEGFVIQPKIMGDRMRLHPLAIIIAVMAGTTLLGGLLGGVLAIPLAAALRVLMFRYVWKNPVN
ncbi:MAG TPA: AI-2E family transporter [Verrucomicrobiae bacterium]|nr:AI-2E family transporter [Verrucomicrobiae bacterium]